MEDAGMDPLEGEVENAYRLLTEESVSSGVRTETRKKLERNGDGVNQVEADFVTYRVVRTDLGKRATWSTTTRAMRSESTPSPRPSLGSEIGRRR